jgi:hypothetical protein
LASVGLRALTSLTWPWVALFGVGIACLILAFIATFVPLRRPPTEAAAPAPPGSGFDSSKWAVTWGGFLVRSDYDAGHEWKADTKTVLLWLRPPPGEPVDASIRCQVKNPAGESLESPTIAQVGGPVAPGSGRRSGVPNADYMVVYPDAFSTSGPLPEGAYEVLWLSGDTTIHGDSFELKEGRLVR